MTLFSIGLHSLYSYGAGDQITQTILVDLGVEAWPVRVPFFDKEIEDHSKVRAEDEEL